MIQITKDIWVNIMSVIWVEDVYEDKQYKHTKIVTVGGNIIISDLRAEQIISKLKLD